MPFIVSVFALLIARDCVLDDPDGADYSTPSDVDVHRIRWLSVGGFRVFDLRLRLRDGLVVVRYPPEMHFDGLSDGPQYGLAVRTRCHATWQVEHVRRQVFTGLLYYDSVGRGPSAFPALQILGRVISRWAWYFPFLSA